jgi:hypothetical protein
MSTSSAKYTKRGSSTKDFLKRLEKEATEELTREPWNISEADQKRTMENPEITFSGIYGKTAPPPAPPSATRE